MKRGLFAFRRASFASLQAQRRRQRSAADEPTIEAIAAAMERAGIDEDKIYAFRATGWLLTEEGPHSPEQVAEWNAAITEFHAIAATVGGSR
jgi:hypothetical protein